jgi:hypothetical protein
MIKQGFGTNQSPESFGDFPTATTARQLVRLLISGHHLAVRASPFPTIGQTVTDDASLVATGNQHVNGGAK